MSEPEKTDEQQRPQHQEGRVLTDAPNQASWLIHVPDEVETVLNLLDGAEQGISQDRKSYRSGDPGADALRELHDLPGDIVGGGAAHGTKELGHDRLEVMALAEYLEDGEGKGYEWNDGQERRIDEAHGPQVDS